MVTLEILGFMLTIPDDKTQKINLNTDIAKYLCTGIKKQAEKYLDT